LILEAAESDLAGQIRHNFRGYNLVPAHDKLFLSRRRLPLRLKRLLSNNGFTNVIVGDDLDCCWPAISREATLDQICEGRLVLGAGIASDVPNIRTEAGHQFAANDAVALTTLSRGSAYMTCTSYRREIE
jgi:hypothetical protein